MQTACWRSRAFPTQHRRSGRCVGAHRSRRRLGTACAMRSMFGAGCLSALENDQRPGPRDEDCLYLNVWTAAKHADEKRPVMVWIHGGGFQFGSSANPATDGGPLAAKGVVVVSFNYRLGIFGFLAHPDLDLEAPVGQLRPAGSTGGAALGQSQYRRLWRRSRQRHPVRRIRRRHGRRHFDGLAARPWTVSQGHWRKRRILGRQARATPGFRRSPSARPRLRPSTRQRVHRSFARHAGRTVECSRALELSVQPRRRRRSHPVSIVMWSPTCPLGVSCAASRCTSPCWRAGMPRRNSLSLRNHCPINRRKPFAPRPRRCSARSAWRIS